MKAQPSTLIQFVSTDRARAVAFLIAGLLVLAAIAGSAFALSQRTPATPIAARGPANRPLLAHCQPCRDEALAARQVFGRGTPHATQPVNTGAGTLIASCRICRDEALGARQAMPQAARPAAAQAPAGRGQQGLIASCRVCRDEALGAMFPQLDDPRRPGPR